MDINKILNSDYLDILFDGKNKKYGSYELRKKYPERVRNAAIIGLTAVLLLIAGPIIYAFIAGSHKKPIVLNTTVNLTEPPPIDPNKKPPPPPPPPPPPVKPTVKFTPPVIEKDKDVHEDEKPPEQQDLKDKASGLQTHAGDTGGVDPGIKDQGTGTGVVTPPPPKIFTFVEQQPEPDYDLPKYLSNNLVYPDQAKEANISGRVIVRFVVNEDGSISDVQLVRGIGSGCDEEAMRVIKKMPKWKAGKQNGKAVKVYFTQPITFKLE